MRITMLIPATFGLILAASQASPVTAQAAPAAKPVPADPAAALAVEQGEGRAVANKLADDLVSSFVYRDQAKAYAAMLRKNAAAGRYDSGTRGELAKLLTDDLQSVHKDGHLHVMLAPPVGERERGGGGGRPKNWPALIQSAKTIAPGIGYIRFTAFMGRDEEMAALRKWLADNRDAKTLIFDLRNHHGGGLDEQDAIFSYVYGSKTPLVKMAISKDIYDRRGSPVEAGPTLVYAAVGDQMVATHSAIPGEDTALRKAKIYLLTSNRSASAAEHFALALKSTGRATLIGEATAGANHFGGGQPINEHFAVWMPIGRTYDIKTGKDWEGDGIAPDIAVDPKLALVTALERAGLSHEEAVRLDALEVPAEPVHSDKLKAR
ncbi:S41 family peptidase [Sphingomonas flavescens]|uniref:S41 family peptidase n=1 Tax=Sphingomonas flavescens TaxID=3132797 RepID=UPI002804FF6F|nr:S41 family peptidase [Sphingomonas limnosediminicola]